MTRGSTPSAHAVSDSAAFPADDAPLTRLRGLGSKSAEALAQVGIISVAQLREAGSIGAYEMLVRAGVPVSLNMLWALEGALSDRDWRVVASGRPAVVVDGAGTSRNIRLNGVLSV